MGRPSPWSAPRRCCQERNRRPRRHGAVAEHFADRVRTAPKLLRRTGAVSGASPVRKDGEQVRPKTSRFPTRWNRARLRCGQLIKIEDDDPSASCGPRLRDPKRCGKRAARRRRSGWTAVAAPFRRQVRRRSGGELEPRERGCDNPVPCPDSATASFWRRVDFRPESGNQQGKCLCKILAAAELGEDDR